MNMPSVISKHAHKQRHIYPITDQSRSCNEDIAQLFNNQEHSDLVLNVDGTKFYAHKCILVIRSEYFRTMISSEMSESNKKEITIVESNVDLFEKLLRYIYTGKLEFTTEPILNEAVDMLMMANKYLFSELQESIAGQLSWVLSTDNFCSIYSAAYGCSAITLGLKCLRIADSNPCAILREDGFSRLPVGAIKDLISRASFKLYQIEVFTAICDWITRNGGKEKCAKAVDILLSEIELHRMPMDFLKILPSDLFPDNIVLDAMKQRLQISVEHCCSAAAAPDINLSGTSD